MSTPIRSTALALALLAGAALPAVAAPNTPPTNFMGTETAYVLPPMTAYAGAGNGGLTIRNGLGSNIEWFLDGTNLNLTPGFALGTDLGAKYQYMQTDGGLAGAVYAGLMPNYMNNAFGLGLNAGLAFSQTVVFGLFTFSPNVMLNNLTTGMQPMVDLNLGLNVPVGGGWQLLVQDIPALAFAGGTQFSNTAAIGGRFIPTQNTALDVTIGTLGAPGSNTAFNAGLLNVTGYIGW